MIFQLLLQYFHVFSSLSLRLHYPYILLSPSAAASAACLAPARSMPSCSHQLFAKHIPVIRTVSSHRSRMFRIAMYCAIIFFLLRKYSPISSNPNFCIDVSSGGYSQLPYTCRCGCLPIICCSALCLNPPGPGLCGGSSPTSLPQKSELACKTASKNISNTLGMDPSLPSILDKPAQPFRAFRRFPTTAAQSTSKRRQDPLQIFERCYRLKRPTVRLKVTRRALNNLLCRQPPPFPLSPIFTLGGGEVPGHLNPSTAPTCNTKVTMVGGVCALLQYYHGVPDMHVQKIHSHRRPRPRPLPTSLDEAYLRSPTFGEAIKYLWGSLSGGGVSHCLLPT